MTSWIFATLISIAACDSKPTGVVEDDPPAVAPAAAAPVVALLYPVKVDALEEVERGIRDSVDAQGVRFVVESAQGNPDNFQKTAKAALRQGATVVVGIGTQMTQAALSLGGEQELPPVVFTAVTNPEDVLSRDQLAPPRQMAVTGISDTPEGINDATIDLVLRLRPDAKSVGVLYTPGESNSESSVAKLEEAAKAKGVELVKATTSGGIAKATSALLSKRVGAIIVPKDKIATSGVASVVESTLAPYREGAPGPIPPVVAMDSGSVSTDGGAVAAVSAHYYDIGKSTGAVVNRILLGEDPRTIAITQPSESKVYINRASASLFCLTGLDAGFPGAVWLDEPTPEDDCVLQP